MQKSDWKKCKLKDCSSLITRGITPKYSTQGIFVLNQKCIRNGKISYAEARLHDNTAKKVSIEKFLQVGDTLVCSTGVGTLGRVGRFIESLPGTSTVDSHVTIVRPCKDIVPLFLSYAMINRQSDIESLAEGTTGQTELSRVKLGELVLDIPPLDEQKRIAEILGSLDDKIELLQKQNKTLEDMAKALFKSWFVDFDVVRAKQKGLPKADIMREYHLTDDLYDLFPSDFENSSLGPIPLGWQVKNLDSLCERCQSGGTPSTKHEEYWKGGTISWFSTKELQDSFLLNSEKNITEEGLDNSSAKLFPKGTIIMAIYASPTVGRLGILTKESTFNQAAVGFIPNEEMISKEYLFLLLKQRRDDLNNLANGAAQQNLSVGVVKAFNVLIPTKKLNFQYKKIISPLFEKMEFNIKQIQTLTELRDTLLPPLISGKIRV